MFDSIYIHHIYTSRTSTVGRPDSATPVRGKKTWRRALASRSSGDVLIQKPNKIQFPSEFLWISTDFYGFLWDFYDFYRFPEISMYFCGFLWDFYGFLWDFYGFLWISTDFYGSQQNFPWISIIWWSNSSGFQRKKHHAGWEIIVSSSQSTFSPVRIMISHQNSMISKFWLDWNFWKMVSH